MSGWLLDTSAYSAFMRGHAGVKRVVQTAEELSVTPVVLGELHAGFRRGAHRVKNERELATFLDSPRVTVLPVVAETARRYAVIVDGLRRAGTPIPTNDLWIAASAMEHGLTVVTLDRHYASVPQVLVALVDGE
ncbi:MAG TPA: type II toxin-antitoxin system VapC family toxin [Polyangia bacterium]|jgi:predicted nucleic acid-binding protein